MTTLTTDPLAPLLDRLFEEAAAASPATSPAVADLFPEERSRLMRSKTDYLDFYGRLKDLPLAVSRETGALLYMLARSCGARTIVEFGTSFGIFDPAPRRSPAGQWRRPPDHQRVRAVQAGAGPGSSDGGRPDRPRGDPRGTPCRR